MKTINIHLHALPLNTPPEDTLFLAGNINDWQPNDMRYRFQVNGDGSHQLRVHTDAEVLEFKITRGTWPAAEGNARGNERPNRVFKPGPADNDLWLTVESWTDQAPASGQANPGNILLLHPNFYMPQLGRYRRIWACLPPDYWSGRRQYPVVYMQDGQNLFDNPDARFGSWGIDKALNRLFLGDGLGTLRRVHPSEPEGQQPSSGVQSIIIGVENGGEHRIDEYSAWENPEYGGGQGEAYLDFVCETLKPFVDEHLRTLSGREHTGIIGSSMGGLMALFAALKRPDVFGMTGVFSPSLWFSKEIFRFTEKTRPKHPVRILLMAGQQESTTMVSDLLDLYETLLATGHADEDLHYDLHSDGTHSEWFWAREFEHALRWLLGDMPGHSHGVPDEWIRFRLDEASKELIVRIDERLGNPLLEVRDYCHDRQFRHPLQHHDNRIPYATWEECLYSVRLLSGDDLVFSRRVHLNQVQPMEASRQPVVSQAEILLTA